MNRRFITVYVVAVATVFCMAGCASDSDGGAAPADGQGVQQVQSMDPAGSIDNIKSDGPYEFAIGPDLFGRVNVTTIWPTPDSEHVQIGACTVWESQGAYIDAVPGVSDSTEFDGVEVRSSGDCSGAAFTAVIFRDGTKKAINVPVLQTNQIVSSGTSHEGSLDKVVITEGPTTKELDL